MLRDFDGIDSSVTAMWLKGDDHAGLEATGLLILQILLTSATKSFEIKAGPQFGIASYVPVEKRLDKDDASYVDVYHTNSGVYKIK